MIDTYHVNQFKFDGTGNANHVFPGSLFDSDFEAAIALITRLRQEEPQLFVNLTTGTFPSPFWLRYADSIWRNGEDHDFAGVGTWRQKWMTYRDAQTYKNIVQAGPLFPLNSLMLHGLLWAKSAETSGNRSRQGFQQRGVVLLRKRNAVAGDVHHTLPPQHRRLEYAGDRRKVVSRKSARVAGYALDRRRPWKARKLWLGIVEFNEIDRRAA